MTISQRHPDSHLLPAAPHQTAQHQTKVFFHLPLYRKCKWNSFPLSTHKGSFHDSDKESKLLLCESFFPNVISFGQVVGSCKGDPTVSVCF